MRKTTVLLSILLAVSVATAADAAKRKRMAPAPKPMAAYTNEQSGALMADGIGNWFRPAAMQQPAAPAKRMAMKKRSKRKM